MCQWLRGSQEVPVCRGLSLGVEKLAELFGVFAAVSSSSRAVRLWVPDCTGPPLVSVPVSTNALCLTEVCTRQEPVGPFLPPLPQARDIVKAGILTVWFLSSMLQLLFCFVLW